MLPDHPYMRCLEEAVHTVADPISLRKQVTALISCCEEAKKAWQEYLSHPGPAGDRYSIVSWIGAARSRHLHEISLQATETIRAACTEAGAKTVRFLSLEENIIVLPYRMLRPNETGPEAAQAAIETLAERIAHLQQLVKSLG